jgi:type IV pilus assembly protein PilY1
MVFAGGNDGMLHAFKLGTLEVQWAGQTSTQKARLTGSDFGKEIWAFIPNNVLPYLQYQTRTDYCHVYSVDFTPYVFDASIGSTGCVGDYEDCSKYDAGVPIVPITNRWRTILIGGMRFGGACKNTCPDSDCVETPATDIGYSTYFAIDITDQSNPTLMWEFSNENLGFTTSGPTVVRIGSDKTLNGKWFVVFGSGPTGPISTTDQQFLGRSNQNLRFFILDLTTGNLLRTIDTSISNSFAGSMLNATMDVDVDYQDDVLYAGYVEKNDVAGTWTDGGVIRIQTNENENPASWSWVDFYSDAGAVTSAVVKLLNPRRGQLWVFFGSGRYFYQQLTTIDDATSQRTLFGLKDTCYTSAGMTLNCATTFTGTITDVTSIADADPDDIADGWKIDLDPTGSYTYAEGDPAVDVTRDYMAERTITDPLASSSGLVFFTTYKPYNDVCAYGGKSFIWSVRYSTGGAPGALLKGIGLLQVSTGSIEQLDLSAAFTEKGGRRTSALEGVPPTHQGLSLLSTPPPVKRTIHMKER